ncbi:hypothetical protein ACR3K2_24020 [Cryptosporidium serpentis]
MESLQIRSHSITTKYSFEAQIRSHWGNPFYILHNDGKPICFFLDEITWKYAKKHNKSIGIWLGLGDLHETNMQLFCSVVIYSSGKILDSLKPDTFGLKKILCLILSKAMIDNLFLGEKSNYGSFLNFEETLYLLERGAMLLFSWDHDNNMWLQTPIMYLYSLFTKYNLGSNLISLKSYTTFCKLANAGYYIRRSGPKQNTLPTINFRKIDIWKGPESYVLYDFAFGNPKFLPLISHELPNNYPYTIISSNTTNEVIEPDLTNNFSLNGLCNFNKLYKGFRNLSKQRIKCVYTFSVSDACIAHHLADKDHLNNAVISVSVGNNTIFLSLSKYSRLNRVYKF